MSDVFAEARAWVDQRYAAGANRIGVTCNPIRRKLYLVADKETLVIDCRTQRDTRILKDWLQDYIGRLDRPTASAERETGTEAR